MAIELDRKSGVPLYVQIKRHITTQISKNVWRPGYKLPTERELANMIGVSRNTVSMAYKELEDENILISRQGKGTFVVEEILSAQKSKLLCLLETSIEEAVQQGYSHADIMQMVDVISKEKITLLNKVHILFIECNHEQVAFFANELSMESGIYVEPLVLENIDKNDQVFLKQLQQFDLVVTTFFHYDEVKGLVGPHNKEVIGISLEPQLETMIKIAQITQVDKGKKLGLVCISDKFAEKVENAIKSSGIELKHFDYTTTKDSRKLQDFIATCDYVLTSPGRKKEVLVYSKQLLGVIEFVYRPDVGSVNMLKKAVLNYQSRFGKERDV